MRLKLAYFSCAADIELGNPVPIKRLLPQWYKDAETYYTPSNEDISLEDGTQKQSEGLKTCAPFLDTLLNGYCFVTPFDIYVGRTEDGALDIKWNAPVGWEQFLSERPKESGATMPRPAGHAPNHLVWSNRWGAKMPRGYSMLITHPLNRHDLPFTTQSGLIDADKFWANGNIPFFIKEDFVGMIPKGTPFAQVIPIKRNSWKMIITKGYKDTLYTQGNIAREKETSYKKINWVKKVFN